MNTPILTITLLASLGSMAAFSGMGQTDEAVPLEFPKASPPSTVTQRVGMTDVEIKYCRPSKHGRKIFGSLEPYGAVWRAGANAATTISFSSDVLFGGSDVPAGTYALFAIPGESEWTVILNTVVDQFGAYGYNESQDLARATVKPTKLGDPVETLTFGFDDLSDGGKATLFLEWETTRVAVPIDTKVVETMQPRIEAAMSGDGDLPYFASAMFYYAHGLDLDKAAEWIEKAVEAQPEAFWISYRQGLILEKKGDKAGAIAAAKASLALASKSQGAIKAEYTRLNEALIARCE